MRPVECEFEADVLAAAVQSRWPGRVDPQLREHVRTCQICADVAAIAAVFDQDRDQVRASAAVPDASRVWWLARLRARREAAAAAARPITATQVVAFASVIALMGACFGATSTWFQATLKEILSSRTPAAVLLEHGALAAGMLALLLLLPAAIYLAIAKD